MAGFESRIIAGRSPTGEPRAVEVTAAGELVVAGGATQYPEDTPSAGGDLGTMALAIRNDAGGTLVDANGDYAPLQVNAAGQLIIAGGAGGTSMADDAPFAPGTTQITPMGAMLDDIVPDTVNEGDAGIPRMSANRNLYVRIRDNAGNERGLNVDAGGRLGANIHDGAGTALTSTPVGADQALDVNIVAGAGAGGTSMVDDAVFTPEATAFTPVGGMLDDVAPDSIGEGDAGIVRMSANRNIYVRIRDDQGNERGLRIDANGAIAVTDGGGAITVDNTVLSVVGGGAEATAQRVTIANDSTGVLTVDDGGGSLTIDGAVTIQEPLSVDDNGGSLTIDNAALSVLGGGVEAGTLRVTIANDSTGLLSIDDNGGSLTVDGGVTADVRDGAGNALTSTLVGADQALDVNIVQTVGGAGGTSMADDAAFTPATTQITPAGAMFDDVAPDSVDEGDAGIVRMSANRNLYTTLRDAAGNERGLNIDAAGAIAVTNAALGVTGGGVEATALRVTIANDSTGLISVDDNGGSLSVDDNAGSLTVDNPVLSVVGGGTEATAQRVTIANDSTGVLSVDDAGGSLTVDGGVTADIRDGGGTALTSTLVGADQALDVNIVQTVGGAGGTSMADDAAFTPATTQVTPIAGFCDDTAPDSVDEGDAGAVRMSANRNMYVRIRDDAGNERGLNVDASGDIGITNAALAIIGGGVEAAALRVTIANDSTGLLSIDDNGGSLTVDQNYHDNLLCNANMQVGDADVANGNPVPVSDAGGSLTVDGTITADIRDGAGTALTSTLVGADQALDVNIVAGAGAGGTSMIDDAAFTPATTAITPAGAMFDDVAPDSVDEGDAGVVRMSANRNLYVTLRDAAGNERGLNIDASNNIGVTNAVLSVVGGGAEATAQRVTLANDSTGVLTVDDGGASLTVDNPALSVVGGGVEATALRVTIANDSTGLVSVDDGGASLSVDDNAGSLTVDNAALSVVGGGAEATAQRVTIANDSTGVLSVDDNAGSLTVDQATHDNLQCNANVQVGDADVAVGNPVPVAGTAAEDAACAGNPVLAGGRYHASIVAADAVDDGDAVRILVDSVGGVIKGHRADAWNANGNYAAAQTDTVVKAAPGANLALYVTDILFSTDTAMNIFLEAGAVTITPRVYLAANGGWSAHFQTPIRWTTNTAVTITSSAAGNHSVLILGYTAP